MNTRFIPRTALQGYLKLVRVPIDRAISVLPGNREARKLAVDRADASARAVAGAVLRDQDLKADAQRRRTAADEREQAIRLKSEAKHKSAEADQRLDQHHDQAEQRRRRAAERAEERREAAAKERRQRTKRAEQVEQQRKQTSRQVESRVEERIEEQEPEKRLAVLDAEAKAQREKEEALTAADEASRLAEAAATVKEDRKES
jgi:colicin import membrane protein